MPTEDDKNTELIFKPNKKGGPHLNQVLNDPELPSESEYEGSVSTPQEVVASMKK